MAVFDVGRLPDARFILLFQLEVFETFLPRLCTVFPLNSSISVVEEFLEVQWCARRYYGLDDQLQF